MPALADSRLSRRDLLKFAGAAGLLSALPWRVSAVEPVMGAAPAAILTGAQPPAFNRFRIGSIDAILISDGRVDAAAWLPAFAPEATAVEKEAVLRSGFLPTDRLALDFNILVLKIGSDVILVDSGYGTIGGGAGGKLPGNLQAAGITPTQVTAVILSHAHPDHFGGLVDAATKRAVFPNAQYFVSRTEMKFWTDTNPDLSKMKIPVDAKKAVATGASDTFNFFKKRMHALDTEKEFMPGLQLLAAPGHTPGHAQILINGGSGQLLHMADTAHHHVLAFAHPEWSMIYDADPILAAQTRQRTLDRVTVERTHVLGYHLPFPGLGHVRAEGKGFVWVPESVNLA